jgi:hypothetical protein
MFSPSQSCSSNRLLVTLWDHAVTSLLILTKALTKRLEQSRSSLTNGPFRRVCKGSPELGLAACSKPHVLISSRWIHTTAVRQTADNTLTLFHLEHLVVHQLLSVVRAYLSRRIFPTLVYHHKDLHQLPKEVVVCLRSRRRSRLDRRIWGLGYPGLDLQRVLGDAGSLMGKVGQLPRSDGSTTNGADR